MRRRGFAKDGVQYASEGLKECAGEKLPIDTGIMQLELLDWLNQASGEVNRCQEGTD